MKTKETQEIRKQDEKEKNDIIRYAPFTPFIFEEDRKAFEELAQGSRYIRGLLPK